MQIEGHACYLNVDADSRLWYLNADTDRMPWYLNADADRRPWYLNADSERGADAGRRLCNLNTDAGIEGHGTSI